MKILQKVICFLMMEGCWGEGGSSVGSQGTSGGVHIVVISPSFISLIGCDPSNIPPVFLVSAHNGGIYQNWSRGNLKEHSMATSQLLSNMNWTE